MALSLSHEGRRWGFVISGAISSTGGDEQESQMSGELRGGVGLVPVQVFEGGQTAEGGFYFDDEGGVLEEAVLKWKPGNGSDLMGKIGEWRGWVLKDSPEGMFGGNPRMFLEFGDKFVEGEGFGRIDLVREFL